MRSGVPGGPRAWTRTQEKCAGGGVAERRGTRGRLGDVLQ